MAVVRIIATWRNLLRIVGSVVCRRWREGVRTGRREGGRGGGGEVGWRRTEGRRGGVGY